MKKILTAFISKIKQHKKKILLLVILCIGAVIWTDAYIKKYGSYFIYHNPSKTPYRMVGLVLGTSKILKNGLPNLYFKYRIDATAELFQVGKIKYIIVSGDNSNKYYNEPKDMKEALVSKGIPDTCIILDYAGLRTLDSMLRLEDIFCQTECTVITQQFHAERAIFLGRKNGISVNAYLAKDVDAYSGFKTMLREKLARVKAIVDVVFHKKAKYSGEKLCLE
jgi:SanA protein